jgi:hypothetical protein
MAVEDLVYVGASWKPDPANIYEMALAAAIDMSGEQPLRPALSEPRRISSTAELHEAESEANDWYSQLLRESQDD